MADIGVSIGADPEGLNRGLAGAQAAIRTAAERMRASFRPLQDAVSQTQAGLRRFSGVIGGLSLAGFVAGAAKAVASLDAFNDAADQTGASVEELSSLVNTLAPFGVGLDQIADAMTRLVRAMSAADDETKGAGEAFAALGIKVRDSAGNLRPPAQVLDELATKLATYRDGANKTALVQAIYGRSGTDLMSMLKDLAEAQREAGTVTGRQAEQADQLVRQMNALRAAGVQLAQEVAGALVPRLSDLLGKLRSIAELTTNPLQWGRFLFGSGADIDSAIATVEADIARLNEVIAGGGNNAGGRNTANPAAGTGLLSRLIPESNSARIEIGKLQSELVKLNAIRDAQRRLGVSSVSRPGAAPAGAPGDEAPALAGGGGGDAARASAAAALATRQQQALLQMDQQLLKEQQLGQAELMRIRTTTGEYRTFSESVKVRLMLAAEELDRINALEAAIKAAGDAESEDIKALAALRREALAGLQRQNDELDRAAGRWRDLIDPTRQYTRQLQEIRALVTQGKLTPQEGISAEFDVESARQDALDQGLNRLKPDEPTWLGTLEGGFRRLFGAIQQGSVTARGVFLGALEMMGTALANTLAKMAASWASTELFKTRVTATGAATRTGVETAAAAKSVAVTSSAASTNIMTRAYEAMAGAYAAIAGIPYVGPVLAPVAAGVAFGAVASLAGRVFSARGGFDVPANINPMTQLHAREMVLPAEQADVIRRLGASGGATQQQPVAVHVHANDARSVEDLIGRDHRRAARLAQRMSSIASVRRGT